MKTFMNKYYAPVLVFTGFLGGAVFVKLGALAVIPLFAGLYIWHVYGSDVWDRRSN